MLPTFLTNKALRLLFFGGKGGVGKTTTAAASALLIAEKYPHKKVILISTDPAHSLGDSFEMKLSDNVMHTEVCSPTAGLQTLVCKNLFLREFSAVAALEHFKKRYGKEIKLIADRGTYFDNEDINRFFDLSFPGIDEVMGILEIAELLDSYEMVLIDTAPTGHTLSMLKLPAVLKKWLQVFALMGEKHHILEEHFSRHRSHDEADSFIETINSKLTRINSLLCNAAETEFVVVTNPEEIVLDETERLLHELFVLKVPVKTLVINRVAPGGRCPQCEHRSAQQRPFIERLEKKSSYRKVSVPLFPSEIRGAAKLKMFGLALTGVTPSPPVGEGRGEGYSSHPPLNPLPSREGKLERLPLKDIDHANFIMVGGKGGVGKTTTAAATAVLLAEKDPGKRYDLYSIDPAHSLGDCFRRAIGDKGAQILPNLRVFELDADKLYLKFQEEYCEAINGIFDQFTGGTSSNSGIDLSHDRELLNELIEMAPPGLNELMALHKVISELEAGSRKQEAGTDCIIVDTAPTGHFVRFLELPALVRKWLNAIFELLLKYKGVVRLGPVAERLVRLSKDIRSVMDVMTDHKKTATIVVTIPKAMAVVESERLIKALSESHVRCDWVVVNMAAKTADCPVCAAHAANEATWINKAKGLCRNAAVVPYLAEDMGGVEALRKFGELVWK